MNQDRKRPSLFRRLFPPLPDFAALLAEQASHTRLCVEHVQLRLQGEPVPRARVDEDEDEADRLRRYNLDQLNSAFSTPFDREDIYRAVEALDWIVVHMKRTARELEVLGVEPTPKMAGLGAEVERGARALETGFRSLGEDPRSAEDPAETARGTNKRARKLYERALAELFQGEVGVEMLKRREIYHHLADGAKRVSSAAEVLQNIVVKAI